MMEFERAVELHRQGLTPQAEALCRDILAREPRHPRALHLLGAIRFAAGETLAAIGLLKQALAARPDYAEAQFNLGAMLAATGDAPAAADHYRRAAELKPEEPEAWARLGAVLMNLDRASESEAAFRQALALRPNDPSALTDLSVLLHQRGALDEAIELGRRAVALAPDMALAHLRLGGALSNFGEWQAALAHCRRAAELAPDQIDCWRALLMAVLYAPGLSEDERFAEHLAFGRIAAARVTSPLPPPRNERDPERRLRVGWLSSDFRYHTVAQHLRPLFLHRDTSKFDAICYADVLAEDDTTGWFRSNADLWRDIAGSSDADIAAQIRSDSVDVMIYVAGRFDRNRPQVAAWRPAPVQVSLHDGATSGLAEMDYLVADGRVAPRNLAEKFTERILRLPNLSVQSPPAEAPDIGPLPSLRSGMVTFGSFNNPAKLNGEVLLLWADLLRRLPEARLRLAYKSWFSTPGLQERVGRALGPDVAARVSFEGRAHSRQEHLDRYNQIDVALDAFPFTGDTTTFEALWMGVPVITLMGSTIASRWSASMLTAAGLPDMIARSPADYVTKAAALVHDAPRLAALRAGLRARVAGSNLCDGPRMTRYLERLLRAAWREWCSQTR